MPHVDVLIMAQRGGPLLEGCLASVLAGPAGDLGRIVVAHADDPAAEQLVREVSQDDRVELVAAPAGASVTAMSNVAARTTEHDFILLSESARVNGDWAHRLARCARRADSIGTVTSFSNNGGICAYPYAGWWRDLPGNMTLTELDGIFARVNAGRSVGLPSGVGFAMYVRRECFDAAGEFDERRFPWGFGGDTDLCQRASRLGWRNVLAADTFVHVLPGAPPDELVRARIAAAQAALEDAYPGFAETVGRFTVKDPLRGFRRRVDAVRTRISGDEAKAVAAERVEYEHWMREREQEKRPPRQSVFSRQASSGPTLTPFLRRLWMSAARSAGKAWTALDSATTRDSRASALSFVEQARTAGVVGASHKSLARAFRQVDSGRFDDSLLTTPLPAKAYVICFEERSGSTMLSSLLAQTGVLGAPDEFLNPGGVVQMYLNRCNAADLEQYFAYLRAAYSTANGVFGMKTTYPHFAPLLDMGLVRRLLGEVRFIHLTRSDVLRQAISSALARRRSLWHVRSVTDPRPAPVEFTSGDARLVADILSSILIERLAWERFFALHGAAPLRLTYEELVASPQREVARVLDFLGIEGAGTELPSVSETERLADEVNDLWVEKIRAGHQL